jgi:hypothetical protein
MVDNRPMDTFRSHVSALFHRAFTITKRLIMAIGFGICLGVGVCLSALRDIAKDKTEAYATDWAGSIFKNPTAQHYLAETATLALRYPTVAVFAAFLVMLLVIVTISAIQVYREPRATLDSTSQPPASQVASSIKAQIASPPRLARQISQIEESYENFQTASSEAFSTWAEWKHLDTRSGTETAIERMTDALKKRPPTAEEVKRLQTQLVTEAQRLRMALDFDILRD